MEFNNEPPLHQQSSHADSQPSQHSTSRNQIPSTSNQNNSSDSDQRLSQSNGLWKSIEDVTNEKEIKSLSILQLKQILTANFMNYRGCLEKEELVDKVKMLYASTKKVVLGMFNFGLYIIYFFLILTADHGENCPTATTVED